MTSPRHRPPGHRRSDPTRAVRALFAVLAFWTVLFVGVGHSGLVSAAPAQTPTTTQPAVTEVTTPVQTEVDPVSQQRVEDENRKILLIVGGLIVIAVALTLLTIRYWFQTRPLRPSDRAEEESVEEESVEAVSDLVEVDLVEVDDSESPVLDAPTVAVEVVDDSLGRNSRRSVAGADHGGADDDWEPRGTGEHDRVEISARPKATRPGRSARRAALGDAAEQP